jgi:hypothetical protein
MNALAIAAEVSESAYANAHLRDQGRGVTVFAKVRSAKRSGRARRTCELRITGILGSSSNFRAGFLYAGSETSTESTTHLRKSTLKRKVPEFHPMVHGVAVALALALALAVALVLAVAAVGVTVSPTASE